MLACDITNLVYQMLNKDMTLKQHPGGNSTAVLLDCQVGLESCCQWSSLHRGFDSDQNASSNQLESSILLLQSNEKRMLDCNQLILLFRLGSNPRCKLDQCQHRSQHDDKRFVFCFCTRIALETGDSILYLQIR